MSALLHPRRSNERIALSAIHVAFALSILLHAALLSGWLPKVPLRPSEKLGEGKPGGSLAVRLVPPPAPAPAPAPASVPSPALQAPRSPARSAAAPRPAPAERVLAREQPSAARIAPPAEPAKAAAPPPADFAASIEARRRAREATAAPPPSRARLSEPPAESAQERDNRIAAINLGLNRTPGFGDEKKHGGGIFQVERVGANDAEFFFYGWNKAIRRNSRQMIEVRRGDNASTELAVVRGMIAIIREHESSDFIWESKRLRRDVWLSARVSDNTGLEEFMMHEFFPNVRPR